MPLTRIRASAVDKIMSAAAEELDDYPDIETWFEILEYVEENLDDFKAPSSRAVVLPIAACLPAVWLWGHQGPARSGGDGG